MINSTAKVHNGRDAGPIEYTLASHAALGAPRPREARVAQRRPRTSHQIVGIAISTGGHTRPRRAFVAWCLDADAHTWDACSAPTSAGERQTHVHLPTGRGVSHPPCKAEKDGTPPRPSPGAHTACRDLGGLLQGLGLGVELAVVLAGGARVAAEEPAGRRHDTGRRRGAVRPLFCLESFVFLSWRESRSRSRSRPSQPKQARAVAR